MVPPQSILDKNKDLGSYAKDLPLGDCFLSGLLISGFTKEKYNRPTTLLFASDRIVMAQPQCPANGQASFRLFKTNLRWNSIFTVLCTVAYPRGGAIAPPPVKLYIKVIYISRLLWGAVCKIGTVRTLRTNQCSFLSQVIW